MSLKLLREVLDTAQSVNVNDLASPNRPIPKIGIVVGTMSTELRKLWYAHQQAVSKHRPLYQKLYAENFAQLPKHTQEEIKHAHAAANAEALLAYTALVVGIEVEFYDTFEKYDAFWVCEKWQVVAFNIMDQAESVLKDTIDLFETHLRNKDKNKKNYH